MAHVKWTWRTSMCPRWTGFPCIVVSLYSENSALKKNVTFCKEIWRQTDSMDRFHFLLLNLQQWIAPWTTRGSVSDPGIPLAVPAPFLSAKTRISQKPVVDPVHDPWLRLQLHLEPPLQWAMRKPPESFQRVQSLSFPSAPSQDSLSLERLDTMCGMRRGNLSRDLTSLRLRLTIPLNPDRHHPNLSLLGRRVRHQSLQLGK